MARPRTWRQESHPSRGLSAVLLLAALATGCKSGSWGAKPSWWSSSGTPPASALTAAPEFSKDVTKPSEAAKPYPTTETPEAYSLAGGERPAATPGGGSTVEPTSVTYGSTPPAIESPAAVTAQTPAFSPAAGQPDAIGPQVGPYASLQPTPQNQAVDPAAAATAGLAAAPAFGEAMPPPAARVADARGSDSWASAPPPADPGSRYGASPGSRFSSGFAPAASEPPPAAVPSSAAFPPPAAAAPPAAAINSAPAAASPPASPVGGLPGSIPPPTRRPDPGYRPGGTSSYRPSQTILAEDESAAGGVVPASFEAASPGSR